MNKIFILAIIMLLLLSCKDRNEINNVDLIFIDSIKINNVTGKNSISSEKSSISYYFKFDKELNDSLYKIITKNRTVLFTNKNVKKKSKKYYYVFQFYDFDIKDYTLKRKISNYDFLITFDKVKLFIDEDKSIYLIKNKFTKVILSSDNMTINKDDSLSLNKSTTLLKLIKPDSSNMQ